VKRHLARRAYRPSKLHRSSARNVDHQPSVITSLEVEIGDATGTIDADGRSAAEQLDL